MAIKNVAVDAEAYSSTARKVLLLGEDGSTMATALNPVPTSAVLSGDVYVTNVPDSGGLVGKPSGGDFVTAYGTATRIDCSGFPAYYSTLAADDILSIQQTNSSGSVVATYKRDDTAMTVAGNNITIATATFGATDTFVVYTNVARQADYEIGAVELKDAASDSRADVNDADTARTTGTKVLAVQHIDAAGAVLPANLSSTTDSVTVTGTVTVDTMPDVTGTVSIDSMPAVTGTVSVDSIPAITGTISVDSMPAVTGTVSVDSIPAITGTVSVDSIPAITGTISVDSLPAITGTVTADVSGTVSVDSIPAITGAVTNTPVAKTGKVMTGDGQVKGTAGTVFAVLVSGIGVAAGDKVELKNSTDNGGASLITVVADAVDGTWAFYPCAGITYSVAIYCDLTTSGNFTVTVVYD